MSNTVENTGNDDNPQPGLSPDNPHDTRASGDVTGQSLNESQTQKALRTIIITQCFGAISILVFNNNVMLTFLTSMKYNDSLVMYLLALPNVMMTVPILLSAYYSDRYGKKRLGLSGLIATFAGFGLIAVTPLFTPPLASIPAGGTLPTKMAITSGIIIFSLGYMMFTSNWFALLSPIVPEKTRGRFFGILRFSWQLVAILMTAGFTWILAYNTSNATLAIILGAVTLTQLMRILFYVKIPELERNKPKENKFFKSLVAVMRTPGYMPFSSYVFLLTLFIGACPWLFGLLERNVLHYTDKQVVFLGNIMFIGSMTGFFFAGKLVDRFGTKIVFLVCHFTFALVLFLFTARGFLPENAVIYAIGALVFVFGMAAAASSISISTEMLGLLPQENKSLATALNTGLRNAGAGLSGIISGKIIALNVIAPTWNLNGNTLSRYDAMLLGCGVMITLLVVTLSLVPSVIRKAQWMPGRP